MKSDLLNCMHLGEYLLGAGAVLTLLVFVGSIALLFTLHVRSNGRQPNKSTLAGNTETDTAN